MNELEFFKLIEEKGYILTDSIKNNLHAYLVSSTKTR